MKATTKAVALTRVQRSILEDMVARKGVDKETGKLWLQERERRHAAKKLSAAGFIAGGSFGHWYAITDAGRAALKAPRAALCAGCDEALPKSVYHTGPGGFEVTIAPGVEVRVCYGRTDRYGSDVCTAKARERARRCPGCGAESTNIGDVCDDCTTNIERGRTLKDRKLQWWCVVANGLGPSLSFRVDRPQGHDGSDRVYPLEELAKLLGTALTVGRVDSGHRYNSADDHERIIPRGHGVRIDGSDKVHVEVTREQGEAMAALVTKIRQVMYLCYRNGLQDGKDMLGRLARGDSSIRDFERYEDDRRKGLDQILSEFEAAGRKAVAK